MTRSVAVVVPFRVRAWCGTVEQRNGGRMRARRQRTVRIMPQVPAVGAADGEAALLERLEGDTETRLRLERLAMWWTRTAWTGTVGSGLVMATATCERRSRRRN